MTPVKGNIGRFRSGLTALLAVAGGVILCALAGVMTDHLWLAALPTLVLPFAAAYAVTGSAGRVLVAFLLSLFSVRAFFLLGEGAGMWVWAALGMAALAALLSLHGLGLTSGRARLWAALPLVLFGLPAASLYIASLPATGPIPGLLALLWLGLVPSMALLARRERPHALVTSPRGLRRLASGLGLQATSADGCFVASGMSRGVELGLRSRYRSGPAAVLVVVTVPGLDPGITLRKRRQGAGRSHSRGKPTDVLLNLLLETEGAVEGAIDGLHAQLLPLANEQGMTIEGGELRMVLSLDRMVVEGSEVRVGHEAVASIHSMVDPALAMRHRCATE
jgi:hypothetical protein